MNSLFITQLLICVLNLILISKTFSTTESTQTSSNAIVDNQDIEFFGHKNNGKTHAKPNPEFPTEPPPESQIELEPESEPESESKPEPQPQPESEYDDWANTNWIDNSGQPLPPPSSGNNNQWPPEPENSDEGYNEWSRPPPPPHYRPTASRPPAPVRPETWRPPPITTTTTTRRPTQRPEPWTHHTWITPTPPKQTPPPPPPPPTPESEYPPNQEWEPVNPEPEAEEDYDEGSEEDIWVTIPSISSTTTSRRPVRPETIPEVHRPTQTTTTRRPRPEPTAPEVHWPPITTTTTTTRRPRPESTQGRPEPETHPHRPPQPPQVRPEATPEQHRPITTTTTQRPRPEVTAETEPIYTTTTTTRKPRPEPPTAEVQPPPHRPSIPEILPEHRPKPPVKPLPETGVPEVHLPPAVPENQPIECKSIRCRPGYQCGCINPCPPTCREPNRRPCTIYVCQPACICAQGYVLSDNRTCIPLQSCPAKPEIPHLPPVPTLPVPPPSPIPEPEPNRPVCPKTCPLGTRCQCTNPCPATCSEPDPEPCPVKKCNPGCHPVCKRGQVLDRLGGDCIPLEYCPNRHCIRPQCDDHDNEAWYDCSTRQCNRTCANPTAYCTGQCLKPGNYDCRPGTVRDLRTGRCVVGQQCQQPVLCDRKDEIFYECDTRLCQRTCARPEPQCPQQCRMPGNCDCRPGLLRDTRTCRCVDKLDKSCLAQREKNLT